LLLLEYGIKIVNDAGKEALGYPGLWATENKEVRKIEKHLKENKNG